MFPLAQEPRALDRVPVKFSYLRTQVVMGQSRPIIFYPNIMLFIKHQEVGHFGHADVTSIFKQGGWKALLPNALSDSQLLSASRSLRALLYSDDWESSPEQASPVVTMAILLLLSCSPEVDATESTKQFGLSTLQQAMAMLSLDVDREIVSRVLGETSDEPEEALTEILRVLAERDLATA